MNTLLRLMLVIALTALIVTSKPVHAGNAFSYDLYAEVLDRYVDGEGMVDYRSLKANRGTLDRFTRQMAGVEQDAYKQWSDEKKIAYWINAYNAFTLVAIIDNYPIKAGFFKSFAYPKNSIRQIDGVWKELKFAAVGGRKYTLHQIEHEILRKQFDEPRIHMALVCAAMSCPQLRQEPYQGAKLDAQFADQARQFVRDPGKFRIDRRDGRVYLSKIFDWFGEDFINQYLPESGYEGGKAQRASLNYLSQFVSASDRRFLQSGDYSISYLDYDWSLNEQK